MEKNYFFVPIFFWQKTNFFIPFIDMFPLGFFFIWLICYLRVIFFIKICLSSNRYCGYNFSFNFWKKVKVGNTGIALFECLTINLNCFLGFSNCVLSHTNVLSKIIFIQTFNEQGAYKLVVTDYFIRYVVFRTRYNHGTWNKKLSHYAPEIFKMWS